MGPSYTEIKIYKDYLGDSIKKVREAKLTGQAERNVIRSLLGRMEKAKYITANWQDFGGKTWVTEHRLYLGGFCIVVTDMVTVATGWTRRPMSREFHNLAWHDEQSGTKKSA
jgi:hypothetical protein